MELENTPLYNSQFPEPQMDTRTQLVRHMIQASMQETRYQSDIEWGVYHMARELEDTNGLPDGVTSQQIMDDYYRVFHHEH